jgi:hypothetical protein
MIGQAVTNNLHLTAAEASASPTISLSVKRAGCFNMNGFEASRPVSERGQLRASFFTSSCTLTKRQNSRA